MRHIGYVQTAIRELKRQMLPVEYESKHGATLAIRRRAQHKLRKLRERVQRLESTGFDSRSEEEFRKDNRR